MSGDASTCRSSLKPKSHIQPEFRSITPTERKHDSVAIEIGACIHHCGVRLQLRGQFEAAPGLPRSAREQRTREILLQVLKHLAVAEPRHVRLPEQLPAVRQLSFTCQREGDIDGAAARQVLGLARRHLDREPRRDGASLGRGQLVAERKRNVRESRGIILDPQQCRFPGTVFDQQCILGQPIA